MARPASSARSGEPASTAKTVADAVRSLGSDGTRFVAVAPGRLDIMGGLAEYTGALVLGLPIAHHVAVAVQPRRDGKIRITGCPSWNGNAEAEFDASNLTGPAGKPIDSAHGRTWLNGAGSAPAVGIVAALVEAIRGDLLSHPSGGLSISVASTLHDVPGAGGSAPLAAAAIAAATAAAGRPADARVVAAACQRVENHWLDAPVGSADAVCALLGEPNTVQQANGEAGEVAGALRLPDDLLLLGVDSGVTHDGALEKYGHVRTTAFMGRLLVDRIIRHDGLKHLPWDGHLARVSVADFVQRFRDRIPTKMKGKEFLDRFGETGDPLTRIDPQGVYKIRSRTEHHIYEHARSRQFVECLSRAVRTADRSALVEAGEVMYASHWSYGQRCGLGSAATDLLVHLIRAQGVESDIYGAKTTGHGCGGLIAVLMKRADRALSALSTAIDEYTSRTGHPAKLLRGSIPGALVTGVQRL